MEAEGRDAAAGESGRVKKRLADDEDHRRRRMDAQLTRSGLSGTFGRLQEAGEEATFLELYYDVAMMLKDLAPIRDAMAKRHPEIPCASYPSIAGDPR